MGYFKYLVVFTMLALAVTGSRADIPLDDGRFWAEVLVRLEGTESLPEHRFFVRYKAGPGNPNVAELSLKEVEGKAAVSLAGGGNRLIDVFLVAVPRSSVPPAGGLEAKQVDGLPGVLMAELGVRERTLEKDDKGSTGVVIPLRVKIEAGKLVVTELPDELHPSGAPVPREEEQDSGPSPLVRVMLGVVLSVAAAMLFAKLRPARRDPVGQPA